MPTIQPFHRTVAALRYVPQNRSWTKAEHRELASRKPQWESQLRLHNGRVVGAELQLSAKAWDQATYKPTELLLLSGSDGLVWTKLPHVLSHFFNLRLREGQLWLELCDEYYPQFGSFSRGRYDLLPLQPGNRFGLSINAKHWHTLAGFGTDTHYLEHHCYLEHLGLFNQASLLEELEETIDLEAEKEVDLREILY
jgi:hypothetical protein